MELNVAHSFPGLPWGYPHSRIKQRSESYDCSCILFVLSCSLISQHDILPLTTRLDWKQVFNKVTPVLNSIHQWHPTFTTCPNFTRKLNNHEEYWLLKMRGLENIIAKCLLTQEDIIDHCSTNNRLALLSLTLLRCQPIGNISCFALLWAGEW